MLPGLEAFERRRCRRRPPTAKPAVVRPASRKRRLRICPNSLMPFAIENLCHPCSHLAMQLPRQPWRRGLFGLRIGSVGRLAGWLRAAPPAPRSVPAQAEPLNQVALVLRPERSAQGGGCIAVSRGRDAVAFPVSSLVHLIESFSPRTLAHQMNGLCNPQPSTAPLPNETPGPDMEQRERGDALLGEPRYDAASGGEVKRFGGDEAASETQGGRRLAQTRLGAADVDVEGDCASRERCAGTVAGVARRNRGARWASRRSRQARHKLLPGSFAPGAWPRAQGPKPYRPAHPRRRRQIRPDNAARANRDSISGQVKPADWRPRCSRSRS